MMSGRLGVCEGFLLVFFCKSCIAEVLRRDFSGQVNGCELRLGVGDFLGKF